MKRLKFAMLGTATLILFAFGRQFVPATQLADPLPSTKPAGPAAAPDARLDPPQPGLAGGRAAIQAIRFPSLQAALDALPAAGGLVQLPAGKFEIKEPLKIRSENVMIRGQGAATEIVNANQQGEAAIHLAPKDIAQNSRSRIWRIHLADFQLTGNPKSGHGIHAKGVNEIYLEGLTVSRHGGHGILLDECYEDPCVCDCLITYNKKTGLELLGCHDIVVSSNQFEENMDALRCLDGFNLTMTGNNLDDHLGRGVVIENTYGSVLSGNMIEECAADAIVLDRDCYGITLSANVIAHNGAGIDLRDAHGCAVTGNTLTIMKTRALRIGPSSGRITVSGNSISNSYIGDGKVRRGTADMQAAGIQLDGTQDVAITGNQFSGIRPQAIAVTGDNRNILVAKNVLTDTTSQVDKLRQSQVRDNLQSVK